MLVGTDLRVAGDHQLAPHRQRRRLGVRLPLVPPLRRGQHPRRLGHGRDAGGGLGRACLWSRWSASASPTDEGTSLDLVPVLIGIFVWHARLGSLFVYERPLHAVVSAVLPRPSRSRDRPRGDTTDQIAVDHGLDDRRALSWTQIGRIVAWGTLNWLLDCACFAMMFRAIDAPIPWKGLLLAYGAGQLAATLPITPGWPRRGRGKHHRGPRGLRRARRPAPRTRSCCYRIISFWMILRDRVAPDRAARPAGAPGRWSRQAMASEVEAGPEAYGRRRRSTPATAATAATDEARRRAPAGARARRSWSWRRRS